MAEPFTQQAEGKAQQIIKEAEAHREQRIALSTGDAQRFLAVDNEYKKAKDLTKRCIYLETMDRIMKGTKKVLVGHQVGPGVMPYLSLNDLIYRPLGSAESKRPATGGSQ